jgi:hypothetical protein
MAVDAARLVGDLASVFQSITTIAFYWESQVMKGGQSTCKAEEE